MKKIYFSFIVLMVLMAGSINANVINAGPPEDIKKSFDVEPGGKLEIDLETGARIEVESWDKNVVEIVYKIAGRDAELVEVEIEQRGNKVEVSSQYSRHKNNISTDEMIYAKVPAKYNLEFKTMGGSVDLKGLEGEMEGTTMGGSLGLTKLTGYLNLVTMGGEINLTSSKVDGEVKTMGGSILIEDVEGNVKTSTMGGRITQKNVKNVSSGGFKDEVTISTMGGDIDVDDAPYGASVKTMGGDIDVNSVKKYLSAETMGGDIKVKSADAKIKCKTMGGDIYIRFDGSAESDDRDIKLTSLSGDVELYLPADFSMEVEVEIKMDEGDLDRYKIVNDFGLEENVRKGAGDWFSDDHRVKYAEKVVNGGKNKVVIHTVNGNIKILKN